jgi:recombination protein RecA
MTDKISDALNELNKKYGENSVLKIGSMDKKKMKIEVLPTGSVSLDYAFGCGGVPKGRIIEIFGNESSGKSTLGMFLVANVQKNGGKAVWIDAEYSFNRDYAEAIGVNLKDLIISQPNNGEEAFDIMKRMATTGEIDIIVLDSVAALIPERELAGEIKDAEMAQTARLMSKGMKMIAGEVSRTNTAVVFINQVREKIGIYFGKKETTPGGKALKFYSSVRLEVKNVGKLKQGEMIIGNVMRICGVKNKVGLPFREAEFDLIYGKGVDVYGDLLAFAAKNGIIKMSGNTFMYNDAKIGVGKAKAVEALLADDQLYKKIKEESYQKTKANFIS